MSSTASLKKIVVFVLFAFFGWSTYAFASSTVTRFEFPDIRDEFCGVQITFQYCKCAFHNDYCESIGMTKSSAYTYVWNEYREWVT